MLLRKALLIAFVVAPFVYGPSEASAQKGLDRAAVATATADDVGAGQNSQANQDMPPGIARRFSAQTLPPGIQRTRSGSVATGDDTSDTADDTGDTGTTSEPVCISSHIEWEGWTYKEVCDVWDPAQ